MAIAVAAFERQREGLPPLAGGAPFEPSDRDWAEMRDRCERADRMDEILDDPSYGRP